MDWKDAMKQQAALEYLTTYGWMILIIALVLIFFIYLGIGNQFSYAPKVQPGACDVFRPQGPNTTFDISLQGECTSGLPEFTMNFTGINASGYVNLTGNGVPQSLYSSLSGGNSLTIVMWIKPSTLSEYEPGLFYLGDPYSNSSSISSFALTLRGAGYGGHHGLEVTTNESTGVGNEYDPTNVNISLNQWNFVAVTYNSTNNVTIYNGTASQRFGFSLSPPIISENSIMLLGYNQFDTFADGSPDYFTGLMANVQLYNRSLTSNEITALYYEGIGGHPEALNNLIGWWPLNGNANDYSGNKRNGVSTNIYYTGKWYDGYYVP
ncbi:MAG: LamG domain-containing protein [Candidatus Micrarchaeota archaeon]|nr:LamG domain-containing protein [Candidatus Micrarchaeota archaeon]